MLIPSAGTRLKDMLSTQIDVPLFCSSLKRLVDFYYTYAKFSSLERNGWRFENCDVGNNLCWDNGLGIRSFDFGHAMLQFKQGEKTATVMPNPHHRTLRAYPGNARVTNLCTAIESFLGRHTFSPDHTELANRIKRAIRGMTGGAHISDLRESLDPIQL
eukprot:TRINITY_DN13506_c0_g1_i1.p1 TRINITY_DN13506_c0_g1~~TRINITY_DN13506_c0_g1_i1.p1  ORF type:complete len:159 (+),score=15.08 TRINITY_DN13506_c0_g1_i1:561-1037(+)